MRDIDRAIAWYRDKLGFRVGDVGISSNGMMKFAHPERINTFLFNDSEGNEIEIVSEAAP